MASSWTPDAGDQIPEIRKGGFWVTHPQLRPDQNGESENGTNAYLENAKGERVWLWVNDITSDFAMTGSTAQSRQRREFYAHNFAQTTMNVNCQTPNSAEYNRLGAFIRDAQMMGLHQQGNVLKLRINSGGFPLEKNMRGNIKGKHHGIYVDGYIINSTRGAERWVNAPDFQFAFVISKANNFLGLDDSLVSQQLRTIMGIINDPNINWEWENGKPPKGGNGKKQQDGGNHDTPPADPYDNWSATDEDPFTPPNWQ
jgi:hypothetical protein